MAFAIGSASAASPARSTRRWCSSSTRRRSRSACRCNLLLMVVVGGSGYFFGPFVGAGVAVLLPEWLRFAEGYYLIVYAVLVMVLMAFCPTGLLGLVERLLAAGRRRRARATPSRAVLGGGAAMSAVLEVRDLAQDASAASSPSTASPSTCAKARSSASSARTARGKSTLFNCILGQLAPIARRGAPRRPAGDRHAPVRSQSARRQPHLPAAAGLSAAHGAREPDPRGPGAPGHDAVAPVRPRATPGSPPRPSG